MRDFNNLLSTIKIAALEAVEATRPTIVVFGKVISIAPLSINVDQKLTLTDKQLVLTRNVTDYKVNMTVDHITENTSGGSGYALFESHNHAYKGKKEFLVHNALVVGDSVIMIQMQGGQKYIVLDRVVIKS